MANKLKILVREAFNTAYLNKKLQSLNEDAREKGEALGADKAKADEVLAKVINNPNQAINYPWLLKSKSGLTDEQSNYIVDSLVELYKTSGDVKYKDALGNMFSPSPIITTSQNMIDKKIKEKSTINTPVYNRTIYLAKIGSPLESLMKKDNDLGYDFVLRAWGRLFKGGTTVPDVPKDAQGNKLKDAEGNEMKPTKVDAFDNLVKTYTGSGQGFGQSIVTALAGFVKNLARAEDKRAGRFAAPSVNQDGKEMDFGDEYGTGAEGAELEAGGEFGEDEFSSLGGSEELEKTIEDKTGYDLDMNSYHEAIRKAVQIARETGIANEKSILLFEEIMLNHLPYSDIALKHPEFATGTPIATIIRDLITKNKKFNQVLRQVESEYDIPSISESLFPVINNRAETDLHKMARATHKDTFPTAVKTIIKTAQSQKIADTKSLLAFEGFVLDGLGFDEIVDENPGFFADEKDAKNTFENLLKNKNFQELSSLVSKEFGLDSDIVSAASKKASKQGQGLGAQWIAKSGKEMMANKEEPSTVDNSAEDSEADTEADKLGYVFEKFLSENLDKVMENVYKRLAPKINS